MDTLRHDEKEQADFLKSHVAEAALMGLAGSFVFSWTDEWFTGGFPIEDWAFGITHSDRSPKASHHALREVYECRTAELLVERPRVSVVVKSMRRTSSVQAKSGHQYPDRLKPASNAILLVRMRVNFNAGPIAVHAT